MESWPEARIRDGRGTLEIKPAPTKKMEPITTRIRKTIPLGRNKFFAGFAFLDDGKTLLGYTDQGGAVMDIEKGAVDVRVPWVDEPRIGQVALSADKRTFFVAR